ncbi:hypothetical protein BCR35DRAFT_307039 [Leucosporidium creatinivorum]|uniref:Uncharacterized protein n=1 Tax=Leucosporidium creatinivorum TaxID=106004 RepID=A0A1Y2EQY7_9BASI|nr:hypothetical protein BCR35DRAFT_307039 [Leucosporidium creatinivorum]
MAPGLPRPVTLKTVLIPPSLRELLDSMDRAERAPWFAPLEQIYQLVSLNEWRALEQEYKKLADRYEDHRRRGTAQWRMRKEAKEAAYEGIMHLHQLRQRFLKRQLSETVDLEPSPATFERRCMASLQPLMSELTLEEKKFYAQYGLTFDDRSSSTAPPPLSPMSPKPSAPQPCQERLSLNSRPTSPFHVTERAELTTPTLQTRLLPPSLGAFLTTLNQASSPLWTIELEAIYKLIPLDGWKHLESEYAALMARLCALRGQGTAEAEALQVEGTSAWNGIMQLNVLREQYLSGLRLLQKGPTGSTRAPSSPLLPTPQARFTEEELAFYSKLGLNLRTITMNTLSRNLEAYRLGDSHIGRFGDSSASAPEASARQSEGSDELIHF